MLRIMGTVMFPFVLYGCEAWSLTLREDHMLKVFKRMMLRKTRGPKTGSSRRVGKQFLIMFFIIDIPYQTLFG
jgi:hypothetical protein